MKKESQHQRVRECKALLPLMDYSRLGTSDVASTSQELS